MVIQEDGILGRSGGLANLVVGAYPQYRGEWIQEDWILGDSGALASLVAGADPQRSGEVRRTNVATRVQEHK